MSDKQKNSLTKKKLGPTLGFRTPSRFTGKVFSPKGTSGGAMPKFNPSRFKTQHKG